MKKNEIGGPHLFYIYIIRKKKNHLAGGSFFYFIYLYLFSSLTSLFDLRKLDR